MHLKLEKSKAEDQAVLVRIGSILDTWTDATGGMALKLSPALIQELVDKGLLPTEAQIAQASGETQAKLPSGAKQSQSKSPFGSKAVRPAPKVAVGATGGSSSKKGAQAGRVEGAHGGLTGFFMTLQQRTSAWGRPRGGPQGVRRKYSFRWPPATRIRSFGVGAHVFRRTRQSLASSTERTCQ